MPTHLSDNDLPDVSGPSHTVRHWISRTRGESGAVTFNDRGDSNVIPPISGFPYLNANSGFVHTDGDSVSNRDLLPLPLPPPPPPPQSSALSRRNRSFRRPRSNPHSNNNRTSLWNTQYWVSRNVQEDGNPVSITSNNRDNPISTSQAGRSEGSFLSEINRISTRSLLEEMSSATSSNLPKIEGIFSSHSSHMSHKDISSNPINQGLAEFLKHRQMNGLQYSRLVYEKQGHSKKKRKFAEIEVDLSLCYRFDKIRPQRSSFLKNGIKFTETSGRLYSISMLNLNFETMSGNGYLKFESNESKLNWIKEFVINKHFDNSEKTTFLSFKAELIDFEKSDLRYKTMMQQTFDISMEQSGDLSSPDFYSVYQDCLVRKQLSRWMILKPFQNMTIKNMFTLLTCESCLELLQSKFILMKLFLKNSPIPDLLVCIDRKSGNIEIVASESRNAAVTEHMLYEREVSHYDKNDAVIHMSLDSSKYSSASVALS